MPSIFESLGAPSPDHIGLGIGFIVLCIVALIVHFAADGCGWAVFGGALFAFCVYKAAAWGIDNYYKYGTPLGAAASIASNLMPQQQQPQYGQQQNAFDQYNQAQQRQ